MFFFNEYKLNVFILPGELDESKVSQSVKASYVPLIAAKLSEPLTRQEITLFPSCDYLISSSLCSTQDNRMVVFLVTKMTG